MYHTSCREWLSACENAVRYFFYRMVCFKQFPAPLRFDASLEIDQAYHQDDVNGAWKLSRISHIKRWPCCHYMFGEATVTENLSCFCNLKPGCYGRDGRSWLSIFKWTVPSDLLQVSKVSIYLEQLLQYAVGNYAWFLYVPLHVVSEKGLDSRFSSVSQTLSLTESAIQDKVAIKVTHIQWRYTLLHWIHRYKEVFIQSAALFYQSNIERFMESMGSDTPSWPLQYGIQGRYKICVTIQVHFDVKLHKICATWVWKYI